MAFCTRLSQQIANTNTNTNDICSSFLLYAILTRPGNGVPLVLIGAEKTAQEALTDLEG